MKNESRTNKSIKNIVISVIGEISTIVVAFVARTYFIRLLGAEYLGVNGLFLSIVAFLSVAELGFGLAITFSLYKPLAEKDETKIKALMQLFRKVYTIVGLVVIALGLAFLPFLHFFTKDVSDIGNLYVYFILILMTAAVSYFFSYKMTLIIADQKAYIVELYKQIIFVIYNIIQVVLLILWQNFYLFLIAHFVAVLANNLMINHKANKLYPFLKDKEKVKLPKEEATILKKNIRAMFYQQIGATLHTTLKNPIISATVSIIILGVYTNYQLITDTLVKVITIIFTAITASIGNLGATVDNRKTEKAFRNIYFGNFWLMAFCTAMLFTLITPFITLWAGTDYLLDDYVVLAIIFNFYILGMRKSVIQFKTALGLFWYDRFRPFIEAIVGVGLMILLGYYLGLVGIFLGNIINYFVVTFWIEPIVLYKHGFKMKPIRFYLIYLQYFVVTCAIAAISYYATSFLKEINVGALLLTALITAVVVNLLLFLIYRKTSEYKYMKNLIITAIKSIKNKIVSKKSQKESIPNIAVEERKDKQETTED